MAHSPLPVQGLARLALGPVAVGYAFAALAVAQGPGSSSTYAGQSDAFAALMVGSGLALVAAGYATLLARPGGRTGVLAMVAGILWFAPFWVGWEGGPSVVRSLAMIAALFVFPVLAHLLLGYPSGHLTGGAARLAVAVLYVQAALVAVVTALFYDPFRDMHCWANCTDNTFLVHPLPGLTRAVQNGHVWVLGAASVIVVALLVDRLIRSPSAVRDGQWLAGPAAIALACAEVGYVAVLEGIPQEDPAAASFEAVVGARCVAAVLLAVALMPPIVRTLARRRAVARIVAGLGQEARLMSLESALAGALGDPELRIAYWLPESRRYVDSHGRPVAEPVATPLRTRTSLVRDGRHIATITHTAAVADLQREIGAAARLALENELLQAEVRAQLADLRASRSRIVEGGDAHRRRLERDLHDGAQQHVVALMYDLRVIGATAQSEGDARVAAPLGEAMATAKAALDALRQLAHGLYPAVLGQTGLAAALRSRAVTAPIPVELGDLADARFPAPVEMTAYLMATEAIEDAARRGASYAALEVSREDARLVVTVTDDDARQAAIPTHLADRVGAIGGELTVRGGTIRAELPCE